MGTKYSRRASHSRSPYPVQRPNPGQLPEIQGKAVIGIGENKAGTFADSLTLSKTVTSIGDSAFRCCIRLTSLTPSRGQAPNGCSGILTLPNSLTSIGNGAFLGCGALTSVTLPDSLAIVGRNAFRNCRRITSLVLPNSLTSIGSSAFNGCSGITSLTLPDSVTRVGAYAFCNCTYITTLELPAAYNSMECHINAFKNCPRLNTITVRPRVPPAFLIWAVGNSRNRANWQLTTLKRLRNVLGIIMSFVLKRRDVVTAEATHWVTSANTRDLHDNIIYH